MGKRPHTRQLKGNVGCVSGLISLLDFRRGHPIQKLLSDTKHESTSHIGSGYSRIELDALRNPENKHEGATLLDEIRDDKVSVGSTSIKALMEGEMSQTERSLNFDMAAFLVEFYSYTRQQASRDADNKFDLLHSLESISLGSHYHLHELDDHLDQNISFLKKTLSDFAELISQKSIVKEQNDGGLIFRSEKLRDAIAAIDSDRKLFIKLLQDPDSVLFKHIQSLHGDQVRKTSKLGSDRYTENVPLLVEKNDNSGKCNESDRNQLPQKQNRYNFFWRKDKSKGTKPTVENPTSKSLNRIVILKPNPTRTTGSSVPQFRHVPKQSDSDERIVSHFSLREIRRRLRHIIGESREARHAISMDGLLHRIPVRPSESRDSSENLSCDNKQPKSVYLDNRKSKNISSEEFEVNSNSHISPSTSRSESSIYEEAKKHLTEMLNTRVDSLPRVEVSKSLGTMLSILRYTELSPTSSPQRDEELAVPPKEIEDPSLQQLKHEGGINNLRNKIFRSSILLVHSSDESKMLVMAAELVGTAISELLLVRSKDLNSQEIVEEVGAKRTIESNQLDEPTLCGLDIFEEKSTAVAQPKPRPSSLVKQNLMAPESINEKLEQPSPVSVLEKFISDDISSPDSTGIENYNIQVQDQQAVQEGNNSGRLIASPVVNDDCQARFDYIEAVLEASGLVDEFPMKWDIEDQLLEPSLYEEIGIFFCFPQDDPKLLFDCINEVLLDIHESFLKSISCLSYVKRNIQPGPQGEGLIQEVSKSLEWHLQVPSPNTLDTVVKKDLNGRPWMDLRLEVLNITSETTSDIILGIIEEIVFDCWC
ncbi:uncharacterized protein LOC122018622 isoform X1 [Zingiber officinale]|uniref:uncharacterized protein LOC122018622 isoform X1 n=1 Tax=Zingiber officinale TaxID=94328 RepID=UPI001C4D8875|nr:uncharacterized protein LOC122018622 isoform X1 [Zingiber officinale]